MKHVVLRRARRRFSARPVLDPSGRYLGIRWRTSSSHGKERRVPRVLDWSQVEQAIAGETRPRERAILISLRVPRRFHVRCKGNKDRVVVLTRLGAQALAKYLETRATAPSDAALFVTAARRPRASADVPA